MHIPVNRAILGFRSFRGLYRKSGKLKRTQDLDHQIIWARLVIACQESM
jgi:hypothetical protein